MTIETIDELLKANRMIADVWTIADVQRVRDDLTEDQCWQVLQQVEEDHDRDSGIYSELLEDQALYLFGEHPSERKGG